MGEAQWSVCARWLGTMPATVLRLFLRRFEWRSGDRCGHGKGLQEQAVLHLAVPANRSIATIDLGRTNKSDLHGKPLSRSKSFQKCRPCLPTTEFGWTYLHPLTLVCRLPTRYGQGSKRCVEWRACRVLQVPVIIVAVVEEQAISFLVRRTSSKPAYASCTHCLVSRGSCFSTEV